MTLRRPSLLVTFGLLSVVPVVVLGAALGLSLRSTIERRAIENARQRSTFLAAVGLPAYLSAKELAAGLSPSKRALVARTLRTDVVAESLDGLVVRSVRGRVAFASSAAARRSALSLAEDFSRAARGSAVVHRLRVAGRDDLAVSVPLTFPLRSRPSGVAHVLMPYGVVAQQVAHDTRRLYAILLAGLALLYALLFPIAARVGKELRRRAEENERLALHDPLTTLPNRTLFGRRIEQALADECLSTGLVALMVIDLDDFKVVNDTHGHHAGDLLLEEVAQRLEACVRDTDTVARLGGDEFGIVLSRPEAVSSVELVAERIVAALQQPYDLDGVETRARASVGVAVAPDHGSDVEVLLRRADLALYAAKDGGGGYRVAGDPRGVVRLAQPSSQPQTGRAGGGAPTSV